MRNANHYARTPDLAEMRPADRIPHVRGQMGDRVMWGHADIDGLGIQRLPSGVAVEDCLASAMTGPETALPVTANHGRWLVECPCGGAQLTHPDDRRFMCVDCGNEWNNFQWCPVLWPEDWADIEGLLNLRQMPLANYRFGETLAGLEKENRLLKQRGLYR